MKFAIICLMPLFFLKTNAQVRMNLFTQSGYVWQFPIDSIDSLNFSLDTNNSLLNIHIHNGNIAQFPLNLIDSINHRFGFYSVGNGISDSEGNHYNSIILNNGQEWTTENLRTSTYSNGDSISNLIDSMSWENSTVGLWCYYNNDVQFNIPYGKLYNWYTAADARNACPIGWHVASNWDWQLLTNYLGTINLGGLMKSIDSTYWQSPNLNATNESGFSGLPGGTRSGTSNNFYYLGQTGIWWSSTQATSLTGWYRLLSFNSNNLHGSCFNKNLGLSIRCVKD
jgi:uncharacterized protein (TIGR02145 family)